LKEACELSYGGAHYLADRLVATGKCTLAFDKPFFNEFAVRTTAPAAKVLDALCAAGILGGVRVADDMLLVCVTEQRTKEEMDKFVEIVNNI
jgi:glycine dehydrogenase subunit 1